MSAIKTRPWTTANVRREQRLIREELDTGGADPKLRLRMILSRLKDLATDPSPQGALRRYIYAMSALVHHERHGGLRENQIRKISELARAILDLQGIDPTASRLGFLHGDLCLVRSQIYRRAGNQWLAAWEQQVSRLFSGRIVAQGAARQALAAGIRAQRLGHCAAAIRNFDEAEAGGLDPRDRVRARLGRIQLFRLSGRSDAAADEAERAMRLEDVGEAERLDIAWERMFLDAQRSGSAVPLARAVSRGGSHQKPAYYLEAWLFARACGDAAAVKMLPMVKSMARGRAMKVYKQGYLYKCARIIEECVEGELPFGKLIARLGEALTHRSRLAGLDKELLVLAAAASWMAGIRSHALCALALNEYEALSLRLSSGKCRDALGCMGALLERAWYKSQTESGRHQAPGGLPAAS